VDTGTTGLKKDENSKVIEQDHLFFMKSSVLQFLERDYETENLTKRNSKETLKQD
jgi:hypothetical protein